MNDISGLLAESSRTFALSIPLLPKPLRDEVSVAYLLFRIADTIEDEPGWSTQSRRDALRLMANAATTQIHPASAWLKLPEKPIAHAGYARLLEHADSVTEAFLACDPRAREIIAEHLSTCIDGMIRFLGSPPETIDQLREYCYYVAGIVGEMCTSLFLRHAGHPLEPDEKLTRLARSFGEGLQLVNIVRDQLADKDASRRFIPHGADIDELRELAARDLDDARIYLGLLRERGVSSRVIAFNELNLTLARATLKRLKEHGAGVKLSRDEVGDIYNTVVTSIDTREAM